MKEKKFILFKHRQIDIHNEYFSKTNISDWTNEEVLKNLKNIFSDKYFFYNKKTDKFVEIYHIEEIDLNKTDNLFLHNNRNVVYTYLNSNIKLEKLIEKNINLLYQSDEDVITYYHFDYEEDKTIISYLYGIFDTFSNNGVCDDEIMSKDFLNYKIDFKYQHYIKVYKLYDNYHEHVLTIKLSHKNYYQICEELEHSLNND